MLALSVEELRKCGLSGNKTNFILGLAERFRDGQLTTAGIVGEIILSFPGIAFGHSQTY